MGLSTLFISFCGCYYFVRFLSVLEQIVVAVKANAIIFEQRLGLLISGISMKLIKRLIPLAIILGLPLIVLPILIQHKPKTLLGCWISLERPSASIKFISRSQMQETNDTANLAIIYSYALYDDTLVMTSFEDKRIKKAIIQKLDRDSLIMDGHKWIKLDAIPRIYHSEKSLK